jgi:glycosyltransferase involved in cell wall biosynthesis
MRSFHVGISWSTTGAGGSGRVFADLARYLPRNGSHFSGAVAAPPAVANQTDGLVSNLFLQGSGPVARLFETRRSLLSRLESEDPDVLDSHFAFYVFPILDKLRRRPHVVHFHGPWAAESKQEHAGALSIFSKRQIERTVYSRADRVIVLSSAFAKLVREEYGVPEDRIRIIPGAVDLDRFRPTLTQYDARRHLGWPTDRRILLSVRRLVSRMGLDRLIGAMKQVAALHPDVLLYIAGKGRLRGELETKTRQLGLENHVRLLGFVSDEDLPLIYRAADLNVVPTAALEGFGLVAAEALAAGTPSMVTPVGGLPEVVSSLASELVFRSSSQQDIATGLIAALSGEVYLPNQDACLAYAQARFDPNVMAASTCEVYREVC